MQFTQQEIDEIAIASRRSCPFTSANHEIRTSGPNAGNCRYCGTTAMTIAREQPNEGDPQPKEAT